MCSYSRKITLGKGESYGGQLGRSGLSGLGVQAKHMQRPSSSETGDGPVIRAANLVAAVDEKELDKISRVTDKIKAERQKELGVKPAKSENLESHMPDFSYVPQTYENRFRAANDSFKRKPTPQKSDKSDPTQLVLVGFLLAIAIVIGVFAQLFGGQQEESQSYTPDSSERYYYRDK